MTTAQPVSLGGLQVTDPVQLGPYLTAGNPASVGARRLRDMPEVWAAGEGTYVLAVDEDGAVVLVPTAAVTGQGYHHVQTANATSWTVVHDLGFHPAGIIVHDSAGDRVIPHDVLYDSNAALRIVFLYAISGTADLS